MFNRLTLLSLSLLFLLHLYFSYPSPESLAPQIQRQVVKLDVKAPLVPTPFLLFLAKLFNMQLPKYQHISGSGVILQNKGIVITANHVVSLENRTSLVATSTDRTQAGCKVLAQDPDRDLALLQCDGFAGVKGVQSLASMTLKVGKRAVASGYPAGGPLVISDGIVANKLDDKGKLLLSIPAGPGMSGGGVFTYDGELVGIIQMIYRQPPNTLITTNHLQVHRFLHENRRFLNGND